MFVCAHMAGKWGSIRASGSGATRLSAYNPDVGTRLAGFESPQSNGGLSESLFYRQQKAFLYIIGDKSQLKVGERSADGGGWTDISFILNSAPLCLQGGKQDSFQQWEVVPIEVCDVRQVKNSFKKLTKACMPSSVPTDSFLRCVEESEWMSLVG